MVWSQPEGMSFTAWLCPTDAYECFPRSALDPYTYVISHLPESYG